MKDALIVKTYLSYMNDPQASMLNAIMERSDGKLPMPIEVGSDPNKPVRVRVEYVDSEEASAAPGAEAGEE
jgi:hypothetical protein